MQRKTKILKQLNYPEKDKMRKKQWLRQKKRCAILNKKIELAVASLDHQHKLKAQISGPNGRGICRGILHNNCNVVEGKIAKAYKRYGLHKYITLVEYLRNLADYLENPPMKRLKVQYIHPSEAPKVPKLKKASYNKLKKYFKQKKTNKKFPEYPKSGKLIKTLKVLFNEAKLIPQFYKK